jgi:MYXO-CTERM domain-containing protein
MKLTPAEGLSSSRAVFTGEVISIAKNEVTRFGGLEVTLRVGKVWKGDLAEEVKVHTAGSSAACGYPFVEGKTYLVYAVHDEADPMRVSLCSRTALIEDAGEDLEFLGPPSQEFGAKSKAETRRKDCSASMHGESGPSFAWVVLLLAGMALAIRRIA